jgi:hypothetical protein
LLEPLVLLVWALLSLFLLDLAGWSTLGMAMSQGEGAAEERRALRPFLPCLLALICFRGELG